MAADGWQRVEVRLSWPAPPAPTWTPAATTAAYDSIIALRTIEDEEPLPTLDPPHPRLERVLAWLVPRWAQRRAAARRARHQQDVAARIAAAYAARDHVSSPILPSPAGPACAARRTGDADACWRGRRPSGRRSSARPSYAAWGV